MKAAVKIEYIFPGVRLFRIICFWSYLFISNVQFFSSDMVQELNLSILNLEITLGLKQVYLEKHLKTCDVKSIFRPFRVWKKLCTASLYWKMKFLKQATYEIYVLGKLSKFVQVSTRTSWDLFLQRIFWKLERTWNTGSRPHFLYNFLIKCFLFLILQKLAYPDCIYFLSYLVKCNLCFMLRHLMTSWHLTTLITSRTERAVEVKKKIVPYFASALFVYMQNKLAKMYRGQPLMDCSITISSRLASDKEINKKPKWRISKEVMYITLLVPLIFFADNN